MKVEPSRRAVGRMFDPCTKERLTPKAQLQLRWVWQPMRSKALIVGLHKITLLLDGWEGYFNVG